MQTSRVVWLDLETGSANPMMDQASFGPVLTANNMAAQSSMHVSNLSSPPAEQAVSEAPSLTDPAQNNPIVAKAPDSSEPALKASYNDTNDSMCHESVPKKDWDYPVVERMLEVRTRRCAFRLAPIWVLLITLAPWSRSITLRLSASRGDTQSTLSSN